MHHNSFVVLNLLHALKIVIVERFSMFSQFNVNNRTSLNHQTMDGYFSLLFLCSPQKKSVLIFLNGKRFAFNLNPLK